MTLDLGLPAECGRLPAYEAVCWYGRGVSSWRAEIVTLDYGQVSLSAV